MTVQLRLSGSFAQLLHEVDETLPYMPEQFDRQGCVGNQRMLHLAETSDAADKLIEIRECPFPETDLESAGGFRIGIDKVRHAGKQFAEGTDNAESVKIKIRS